MENLIMYKIGNRNTKCTSCTFQILFSSKHHITSLYKTFCEFTKLNGELNLNFNAIPHMKSTINASCRIFSSTSIGYNNITTDNSTVTDSKTPSIFINIIVKNKSNKSLEITLVKWMNKVLEHYQKFDILDYNGMIYYTDASYYSTEKNLMSTALKQCKTKSQKNE